MHSHRTLTHCVIPRYAPMCLVLAGIIAIHIVDNFPVSTIDMMISAFSVVSRQKRIANTYCPSIPPEKSLFTDDCSEECRTDEGDDLQSQVISVHADSPALIDQGLVNEKLPGDIVAYPSPPKLLLKPALTPVDFSANHMNAAFPSPTSPTPEVTLATSLKEMDIEDECWSPLPSNSIDKKLGHLSPLKLTVEENDKVSDDENTHSFPSAQKNRIKSFKNFTPICQPEEKKCQQVPKFAPTIPRFYFASGEPNARHLADVRRRERINTVNKLFSIKTHFTEDMFMVVTKACSIPRYMNLALFLKVESYGGNGEYVTQEQFTKCWTDITNRCLDDHSIMFNILRKPDRTYLSPEDFLPVLEDVVCNHPGLEFLSDNVLFQERYIETVICRIFYENHCSSGKLTLSQFRKYNMNDILSRLEKRIDLNSTHDCFSYKHFYVLYCKFWLLDQDHDLIVSQSDMVQYSNQILTSRITARIMMCGKIEAFPREPQMMHNISEPTLTYMDFIWFLLSEIDKTTRTSIEYWFKCMDLDGDGIISSYELSYFWEEQEERQRSYGVCQSEMIYFKDIICQINDLIKPEKYGQFTLRDLRNSQLAERFFDTFINFHRMQIHESSHNSTKLKRQYLDTLRGADRFEMDEHYRPRIISGSSLDKMSDWCAYAEIEYQYLVAAERNEAIWDDVGEDQEPCQQLDDLDSEKTLSTVDKLFSGNIDIGYAHNLENATQEDLEAILQRVAKTTFSSSQTHNNKQQPQEIPISASVSNGNEDSGSLGNFKRQRAFQI